LLALYQGLDMEIKVVDDFLSSVYVDHIENLITSATLPLYYNTSTLYSDSYKKGKESPQFTHTFVKDGQTHSSFTVHVEPIVFNFTARTEVLREKELVRCKLNVNYRDVSFADGEHFAVHTDFSEDGITALYYVNDCDGDTLFFNKNYKVIKSVSPKKGRLVYFNNQIMHAGQPPKQSMYRSVINFNWI
jgi:hypothetical protein